MGTGEGEKFDGFFSLEWCPSSKYGGSSSNMRIWSFRLYNWRAWCAHPGISGRGIPSYLQDRWETWMEPRKPALENSWLDRSTSGWSGTAPRKKRFVKLESRRFCGFLEGRKTRNQSGITFASWNDHAGFIVVAISTQPWSRKYNPVDFESALHSQAFLGKHLLVSPFQFSFLYF